jgi:hypothetical protein
MIPQVAVLQIMDARLHIEMLRHVSTGMEFGVRAGRGCAACSVRPSMDRMEAVADNAAALPRFSARSTSLMLDELLPDLVVYRR